MDNSKPSVEELELELQRLKTVVNEVGTYIYTKDLEGKYTFANNLVLELFEASLDEVIGKDDSAFFNLELSNEIKKNDEEVLKYGKTIEKEETNVIKTTGELRVYWIVKKPLYDDSKNIIGMSGIAYDITDRKKLEKQLQEQKQLLNTVLDNVDAYIYMKDDNRTFRYVNSKVAKLFGAEPENIIGKRDIEVMPEEVANEFWEMDKKVFDSQKTLSQEELFYDDSGNERHYWSVKLPYKMNETSNTLIGLSTDITELQLLKEELRVQAITDYLTGAYNRRHFVKECVNEFKRAKRHGLSLSIMILDIDWFKTINDSFGHIEGDKVLIAISKMCMNLKRSEDVFARIGGEEFAFLLPHTNLEEAKEFALRIQKFNKENVIECEATKHRDITFSMGISSLQYEDSEYEEILSRADTALYSAKNSGRDRICTKL